MDIRDLKLFRHLADSLHFGRTSQACNITPSGMTRTIQRLEAELNKTLEHTLERWQPIGSEEQLVDIELNLRDADGNSLRFVQVK